MYNELSANRENSNKGKRISIIIHILILLLAWFFVLPAKSIEDLEEKPPFAVKVEFQFKESSLSKLAHDDSGSKRAKAQSAPSAEKPVEEPKSNEVVTKPEEIPVTQPEVIEIPKPEIKIPDPTPTPRDEVIIKSPTPAEEAPVKVSTPTKTSVPAPSTTTSSGGTTSGSTTGTSTTKSSSTDGTGTGKGTSGTGSGATKGNSGDEGLSNASDGTGEYDGTGDGIFGRKVIFRDLSATKAAVNVSGKVVTRVCINRAGIVTFVEINYAETTIKDKPTLKLYLKAATGYKFQPDPKAPKEQCGKLSFIVDNSINNKLRK